MQLIDGKSIAEQLREEIRAEVRCRVLSGGVAPCLGVLVVEGDAGSRVYVRNKMLAAKEAGIQTRCVSLPSDVKEEDVLREVRRMNDDDTITGFIVQLPLPAHIDEQRVLQAIAPQKDADKDIQDDAVRELLMRTGLIDTGATVIVTKNNRPCSLTGDQVPMGAIVIDMGFTRIEDASSERGYRIVGDADMLSVSEKASYIAPVPGGIGPMIIAVLLKHIVERIK